MILDVRLQPKPICHVFSMNSSQASGLLSLTEAALHTARQFLDISHWLKLQSLDNFLPWNDHASCGGNNTSASSFFLTTACAWFENQNDEEHGSTSTNHAAVRNQTETAWKWIYLWALTAKSLSTIYPGSLQNKVRWEPSSPQKHTRIPNSFHLITHFYQLLQGNNSRTSEDQCSETTTSAYLRLPLSLLHFVASGDVNP